MNDDDLTRALEAWAAATDPAVDPITAEEVTSSTAAGAAPPRHRWPMVAAALLVVLGVGVAVVVALGADDPAVMTDDGGPAADRRTQVVVETPDGAAFDERAVRQRFTLHGPCGDRTAAACGVEVAPLDEGPLRHGTSLVVDRALEPGTWALVLERYDCESAGCTSTDAAGRPDNQGPVPVSCTTALEVTEQPAVLVRRFAEGRCRTGDAGDVPALDVPPAWSVRPDLPWDCGQVLSNVVDPGIYSPERDVETLECVAEADDARRPVELAITEEERGPPAEFGFHEAWWRTGTDGTIEVIRAPGSAGTGSWTTSTCEGIDVGRGPAPGARTRADLVDCTADEPLSLDLPPLDTRPPTTVTPTTTPEATSESTAPEPTATEPPTPLGPGTVDVVLDVNGLPNLPEGGVRRWSVAVVGSELASGALTEIGAMASSGLPSDVQLIGDDLAYVDEKAFGVTVDDYVCFAEPPCRGDEMGPRPGAQADGSCTAEAPIPRTGAVLVATFRDGSCTARWADAIPALTVPPAWSLRPPDTRCADLDDYDSTRWPTCLIDVLSGGEGTAEWTTYGDGLRITYLVAPGSVSVVRHVMAVGTPWTVQTCTGLDPWNDDRGVDPTGCGPEEEMPLTP